MEQRTLLSAQLLYDVNTLSDSSYPGHFAAAGSVFYFSANDGERGREVWKSDGTAAGTVRVSDLLPGPDGLDPNPSFLTTVGSLVYFGTQARDTYGNILPTGGGLWVTDGTPAGTRKLSDVAPSPSSMLALGDRLLFTAPDPRYGWELWTSDGTPAGTRLLKDIVPGEVGGYPLSYKAVAGNVAYFSAQDHRGSELWRSDGTEAGTYLVKDVNPGAAHGMSFPSGMHAVGDTVYFSAETGAAGKELWKSDGTEAGTVMVKDLVAGPTSGLPMWFSNVGDALYFHGRDPATGRGSALWKSDGTAAGTTLVKVMIPEGSDPTGGTVFDLNGRRVFVSGGGLWRTDGTESGTVRIADQGFPHFGTEAEAGEVLYFVSATGAAERELWRTDGTPSGTWRVNANLFYIPGFHHPELVAFGDSVYFAGTLPGEANNEPLRQDASLAPAQLVKDINATRPFGAEPNFFTTAGDYVYFLARGWGNAAAGSYKVWRTDGTPQGTLQLFDTGYHAPGGTVSRWDTTTLGSSLVFKLGGKVWITGPQPGSQRVLADIGSDDGYITLPVTAGNKVYFGATTQSGNTYTTRLWVTDGQGPARPLPARITAGVWTIGAYSGFAAVGDVLYFTAGDDVGRDGELWRTDGTDGGTYRVKDVRPGMEGSVPQNLINVGGTLYFAALEEGNRRRLWKSDGTEAGTVPVTPALLPYTHEYWAWDFYSAAPMVAAVGNTLYLIAAPADSPGDMELWKTDGTEGGTARVADLTPGRFGSYPRQLVVSAGRLFFIANNHVYVTDGTAAGTRQLSTHLWYDTYPDRMYDYTGPTRMTPAADGMVYFVASDLVRGTELWRTDGTPEGTAIVSDIFPGVRSGLYNRMSHVADSSWVAALGDTVIFSADDGRHGFELWKARYEGEPVADAGSGYQAVEGASITLSAAGSRPGRGDRPIVLYEWDFNFDGATFNVDATGRDVQYTGPDGPGVGRVALRVTDSAGVQHVDTGEVTLFNRPPNVSVSGPSTVPEGSPYVLNLSAADTPGDTIQSWRIDWGDGTLQTVNGNPPTVPHTYANGPARFVITATAADEDGTYAAGGVTVGAPDHSFGNNGRLTDAGFSGAGRSVAATADGKIVTAGGAADLMLARYNAHGTLDTTFGTGGHVTTHAASNDEHASAVLVLGDGRILVAGNVKGSASGADWVIARYLPDGTLDPSFGDGGVVTLDVGPGDDNEIRDLAVQPDGKFVVAGSIDQGAAAGGVNFAVARFNADGSPDTAFGTRGGTVTSLGTVDRARGLVIQPDGRIVLAGVADGGGENTARFAMARYTPSGALDTTFGAGGKVVATLPRFSSGEAHDVLLQPGGKLVLFGGASRYAGDDYHYAAARFLPSGALDTTFGNMSGNGDGVWSVSPYYNGVITDAAFTPDGKMVFIGTGVHVGRLTAAGMSDMNFGVGNSILGGIDYVDFGSAVQSPAGLAVQPDGKVVISGNADVGSVLTRLGGEPPGLVVEVTNVPPNAANIGADRTVTEGATVSLTGEYTDPGAGEDRTYRWRVTSSNGQVVPDGAARNFSFVPRDEGAYTVEFTVTDDSGQSSTDTAVITAANAPPLANAGADLTGVEGQVMDFVLPPSTDPGPVDTVSVRWLVTGPDGRPLAEGEGTAGRFTAGDDGFYTITVTATDNDGASSTDTASVRINNAPPVITLTGVGGSYAGDEYELSMSAADVSSADAVRSWTIDWGDGRSDTYAAGNHFTARHSYGSAGRYSIVARATDDDGTYTAAPKVVTVAPAPLGADGTLTVTGTQFDDLVVLRGEPDGQLTVLFNGAPRAYGAGSVRRVVVNLLGSNDDLGIVGTVPETSADLGDGNDNVILDGAAAGTGLTVTGGAGVDTFQTADGAGGEALFDGGTSPTNSFDALVFNGTGGDDTIHVNPVAAASAATVTVGRAGGATVGLAGVERVTAHGGAGNDAFTLTDTNRSLNQLRLIGGDGDDTFVVGDPARANGWVPLAPAVIEGGAGNDSVTYNDQAHSSPTVPIGYALSWFGMSRGPATISHTTVEKATLNTGPLADMITINHGGTPTLGIPELVVNAGLPAGGSVADWLTFSPVRDATAGQFTSDGPGAGRYTFANYPPVSFTGVERLTGPDYERPAVTDARFITSPRHEIALWFSEDVRSSVQVTDLVVTDLATGQVVDPGLFLLQRAASPVPPVRVSWVSQRPLPPGRYRVTLPAASVQDAARNTLAADYVFEFTVLPYVSGRHVFYNNSAFDDANAGANPADDGAVDGSRRALLPGQAASPANVTNYSRGINGVMVDVAGLPGGDGHSLTWDDFEFHVGRGGSSAWEAAPRPQSLAVRRGAGVFESDRITFTWADGTIRNCWLRVTVKGNANTGLESPDVFYFGNLLGETFDSTGGALAVTAIDFLRARRAVSPSGTIDSRYDFNRDGRVSATDLAIARAAQRQSLGSFVAPPAVSQPADAPPAPSVLDDEERGLLA